MGNSIRNLKSKLRQQVRARLAEITFQARAENSANACAILERQTVWIEAGSILFYAPLAGELDVWRLVVDSVGAGKTVALPRFNPETKKYIACRVQCAVKDIREGKFGIREPHEGCETIALNRLDLILVPGVAFDQHGRRLGRGKGFYDQLLESVRGTTCGVAFDEQIMDEIPVEPHDVHLNCILTPTRWIEPKPRAVLE